MPDLPLSIHYLNQTSGAPPEKEAAMTPTDSLTAPFLEMLKQHQALLYQIIRTYCPDGNDWQDLEQEIVLQLWRSFPNFDDTYKRSTWVYRIAFNVTVTAYRKGRKQPKHTGKEPAEHFFNRLPDKTVDPALEQRREALYRAIRSLPASDRPLLLLHLDGHPYQDIADILGISSSNVGTRLNRIRTRLRQLVKSQSTAL